jgi:hypothetical protein
MQFLILNVYATFIVGFVLIVYGIIKIRRFRENAG